MQQETGRFVNPEPKKQALLDEVDRLANPDAAASPAHERRQLPELGVGELTDMFVPLPNGSATLSIVVEKIKGSGKLFVRGPLDAFSTISFGDVADIKGVKFLVRRVNLRGQIGLRMMTTAEIAEREAREAAQLTASIIEGPDASEQRRRELFDPTRVMMSERTEPTLDVYPNSGEGVKPSAKSVRLGNRARRLEELAIRRARNRQDAENASEARGDRAAEDGPLLTKAERRERSAKLAAERAEYRRLEPIRRAQGKQQQKAEADEQSRQRQKARKESPDAAYAHKVKRALGEPVLGWSPEHGNINRAAAL